MNKKLEMDYQKWLMIEWAFNDCLEVSPESKLDL